jgi:DNA-binding MarR family transcriptional regulator
MKLSERETQVLTAIVRGGTNLGYARHEIVSYVRRNDHVELHENGVSRTAASLVRKGLVERISLRQMIYRATETGIQQIKGEIPVLRRWEAADLATAGQMITEQIGLNRESADLLARETRLNHLSVSMFSTSTTVTGRLGKILRGEADWRLTAETPGYGFTLERLGRR